MTHPIVTAAEQVVMSAQFLLYPLPLNAEWTMRPWDRYREQRQAIDTLLAKLDAEVQAARPAASTQS